MSTGPQATLLPDGRRLHLNHGPIDLILDVFGPERDACYQTAIDRFHSVLTGLVSELPRLRQPLGNAAPFRDPVARRMARAVRDYGDIFVTPMAAVAGSVADEILAVMVDRHRPEKAYVNNGGDIAFHLVGGTTFAALGPAGRFEITADKPARGLATSGWQGRSHSLGIADAVTVVARDAATADAAATLIANAVDLPGHPAVLRKPGCDLSPDSDLGARLVTTGVGALSPADINRALHRGLNFAQTLFARGTILQATLSLQGQIRSVSAAPQPMLTGDHVHA